MEARTEPTALSRAPGNAFSPSRRLRHALLLGLCAIGLAGCFGGGGAPLKAGALMQAQELGEVAITNVAPPPDQEPPMQAGRADMVWVDGYWDWSGRRHVWRRGRFEWARPDYVYKRPRWTLNASGMWVLDRGGWQRAPAAPEQ
ncbi:YXWGXW repeat-containing protein [Diaphorobacter ruginosibacter]|uniref:YXWGXW repeat-containing protein n=1 Tax=Diaphorobacter ruginosibacter TaxID=1715720 RepID=UPI00334242D0